MIVQRIFVADARAKYDPRWTSRSYSLEEALLLAAQVTRDSKKRCFVHELVTKTRGMLWWKRTESVWIPRLAVDYSHNDVRTIERWGIHPDEIDSVEEVANDVINNPQHGSWMMRLEGGKLVTVRRWPPRLES